MKTNKFSYAWIVQGYYGFGWEDLTCGTYREAKIDLKAYRDNAKEPVRIIQRRMLNNEAI